jgi:hypothetical protein
MNIEDIITALELPETARVNRRVPKKMLLETGSPTSADKRKIKDGIEEIRWIGVIKPTTVGVPSFRDETREYLEIAIVSTVFRSPAKVDRLIELIHRAIPYPVMIIAMKNRTVSLSTAHKRWSLGEADQTVLDGDVIIVELDRETDRGILDPFLEHLFLSRQPRRNMISLYQGWIDTLTALEVAFVTGSFKPAASLAEAEDWREGLKQYGIMRAQIVKIRSYAEKETQIARQVELNLELKRVESALADVCAKFQERKL